MKWPELSEEEREIDRLGGRSTGQNGGESKSARNVLPGASKLKKKKKKNQRQRKAFYRMGENKVRS